MGGKPGTALTHHRLERDPSQPTPLAITHHREDTGRRQHSQMRDGDTNHTNRIISPKGIKTACSAPGKDIQDLTQKMNY